jgi:hypothetical protein
MATAENEDARLNELDKSEWRDVSRALRPDWTDEQFEAAWARFCELKRLKQIQ